MEYTVREKVTITAWAISLDELSVEKLRQRFLTQFRKEAPPRQTIVNWKEKLLETGTLVQHRPRTGRPVGASGDANSDAVMDAVQKDPTVSTRRLSAELDISQTTVCRILKKNEMHPYKPIYSQFLCDGDEDRRLQFCEQMQNKFAQDPAFLRKMTFSDECVFSLNGNVNKHNVHYWCSENPHTRICNTGKSVSLTVWACISFSGVVASDISRATMNADRYCAILNEKVVPYFTQRRQMLFQQDGAPPHYSIQARQILNEQMANQWIGRRGPIEWPARSPDLSACDYWLWAHLRQKVYTPGVQFQSIREMEDRITAELAAIPLDMFRKAFRDFPKRCEQCISQNGDLFERS